MKRLFEYLNNREQVVLVPTHKLSVNPSKSAGKLDALIKQLIDDKFKGIMLDSTTKWFDENPRRRNIAVVGNVIVGVNYNDPSNKLLPEVTNELSRIGVMGLTRELNTRADYTDNIIRKVVTLSVGSQKQLKDGNYKITVKDQFSGCNKEIGFADSVHINGYNDFPAADSRILGERFYDCMKDLECRVVADDGMTGTYQPTPVMTIELTVLYDNSKLKKLLNDLKNDKRLQDYARRMDAMSRGLRNYYDSVPSGGYTGD